MSYTFEQKNKGKTYVYKVESFWDKEKKQARQKRIYLGRKDELTGQIKTKRKKIPIGSPSLTAAYVSKVLYSNLSTFQPEISSFTENNVVEF